MHCPKCGVSNDDAARFCQSCGSNVVQAPAHWQPTPQQQAFAPVPQAYAPVPQAYAPAPQAYAPAPQAYAQPQAYAPPPPVWNQPSNNGYSPPQGVPLMRGQSALVAQGNMALARPAQASNNPAMAAVLSLFIVGLGQLVNHDFKKAAVMFGIALVGGVLTLGFVWFAVAVWSAVDAYQVAKGTARAW